MLPSTIVEELVFAYAGQVVFDRFTLKSDDNPVLLQGPSGSGKTTLLKLAAGFLQPIAAKSMVRATRPVLVLQQDGLLPWLTGEQCLRCVSSDGTRCKDSLAELHPLVDPLLKRRVFRMSSGQRRLLELYRALAAGSDLVCLDEPFNFLDPAKRHLFATAIASVAKAGSRILISSHYREDFDQFQGQVYAFSGELPVRSVIATAS